VQPFAKDKAATIVVVGDTDAFANVDAKALDQVLVNLIDNAIKYGGAPANVAVRITQQATRVKVEVCDNGPGLEPRHLARIFERFYRADASRSREVGGTGLGLAIVKHLVESMGGEVSVSNNSPQGAVFACLLQAAPRTPLAAAATEADQAEHH
jgi:two-component system, OmpR family, phosphate regulon sensor histidine kinase PhoR